MLQDTPVAAGGTNTLRDVISIVLESTSYTAVDARTLLTSFEVFTKEEVDGFLALPDRHHCLAELRYRKSLIRRTGMHASTSWAGVVCEKYLKFLASDYTLKCNSDSDTASATAQVALLVSEDGFTGMFEELTNAKLGRDGGTVSSPTTGSGSDSGGSPTEVDMVGPKGHVRLLQHLLIMLLLVYGNMRRAALLVLPVFKEITDTRQSYAADLPVLMSYLLPGRSFHDQSTTDRLGLVFAQMAERGYTFVLYAERRQLPAALTDDVRTAAGGEHFAPLAYADVLSHGKALAGLRLLVRLPGGQDNSDGANRRVGQADSDALASGTAAGAVVERLAAVTPQQVFTRLITEGCAYRARRRAEAKLKLTAKASKLRELQPADVSAITRLLRKVLRLQDPQKARLQQDDDLYTDIVRSDGWVPLAVIQRYVAESVEKLHYCIPEDQQDIVEQILLSHDAFLRYEVGTCTVKGSRFRGQRCARSIYGHDVKRPQIYLKTICSVAPVASVESLPKYGWITLDLRVEKAKDAGRLVLPLYDNIPFVVVFPAEAIATFRHYCEHVVDSHQYDEKLRGVKIKGLLFAEVCLRALAEDRGRTSVFPNRYAAAVSGGEAEAEGEGERRGGSDGDEDQDSSALLKSRWYVFPSYLENEEARTVAPCAGLGGWPQRPQGLPKIFLTGRCARLSSVKRSLPRKEISCLSKVIPTERVVDTRDERRNTRSEFALPASYLGFAAAAGESNSGAADAAINQQGNEDWNADDGAVPDDMAGPADYEPAADDELASRPAVSQRLALVTYNGAAFLFGASSRRADRVIFGLGENEVASHPYSCIVAAAERIFGDYKGDVAGNGAMMGGDDGSGDGCSAADAAARADTTDDVLPELDLNVDECVNCLYAFTASPDRYMLRYSFLQVLKAGSSTVGINSRTEKMRRIKADAEEMGLRVHFVTTVERPVDRPEDLSAGGEFTGSLEPQAAGDNGNGDGEGEVAAVPVQAGALGTAVYEVYEFLKSFLWSDNEVYAAAAELGLARDLQQLRIPLLRAAFTRECENKADNYEVLEFIGDAVMDFVVSFDSFLSSRLLWSWRGAGLGPVYPTGPTITLPRFIELCAAPVRHTEEVHGAAAPHDSGSDGPRDAVGVLLADVDAVIRGLNAAPGAAAGASVTASDLPAALSAVLKFPLPFYSMTDVTSHLCRNAVITALLPPTMQRHFHVVYGGMLSAKVQADVFEAVVGVVYHAELGLNRVRAALRHMFSALPLQLCRATVHARALGVPKSKYVELRHTLRAGITFCPYLFDGARLLERNHSYDAIHAIDAQLWERFAPLDSAARDAATLVSAGSGPHTGALANNEHDSHVASSPFPRVQEKSYATHFTTGRFAYSYRRILSNDTVRLFNRVLSIFRSGGFAFTNEVVTSTTHLVFDVDGASINAYGVVGLFWQWYTSRFGLGGTGTGTAAVSPSSPALCPGAMLVLDCTGTSVVKGAFKESCHVHFPQVVVRVRDILAVRDDFMSFLFQRLVEMAARLMVPPFPNAGAVRLLSSKRWRRGLLSSGYVRSALDCAGREPHRYPKWDFCSYEDLVALSGCSEGYLLQVMEHLGSILAAGDLAAVAALFRVSDTARVIAGIDRRAVAVVEDDAGECWVLPGEWVIIRRDGTGRAQVTVSVDHHSKEKWGTIIDGGMAASCKLRMYLCDKCDTVYGFEHRPLLLDRLLLPSGVGARGTNGSSTARELRVERPDMSLCTDEAQRAARQRLTALRDIAAMQRTRETKLSQASFTGEFVPRRLFDRRRDHENDAEGSGFPVLVAHASTLRLTSLRCPQYRDRSGLLVDAWRPLSVSHCGSGGGAGPRHMGTPADPAAPPARFNDALPTYESVVAAAPGAQLHTLVPSPSGSGELSPEQLKTPVCSDWGGFVNACKLLAHRQELGPTSHAVSAMWWSHSQAARAATFYVGSEAVFTVPRCASLADALAPNPTFSGGAMESVAHLMMPQMDFTGSVVRPEWTRSYGDEILPLFVGLATKLPRPQAIFNTPPVQKPQPPEQPQPLANAAANKGTVQEVGRERDPQPSAGGCTHGACPRLSPSGRGVASVSHTLKAGLRFTVTLLERASAAAEVPDGLCYYKWCWSAVQAVLQCRATPTEPLIVFADSTAADAAWKACTRGAGSLLRNTWSAAALARFLGNPSPLLLGNGRLTRGRFSLVFFFSPEGSAAATRGDDPAATVPQLPLTIFQSLTLTGGPTILTDSIALIEALTSAA